MSLGLTIIIAIFLDYLFGEVRKFHPLVGFGNLASILETRLNQTHYSQKIFGMIGWTILVLPIPIMLWNFELSDNAALFIDILVLYFAMGLNSLRVHVLAVYYALKSGDLNLAREKVSMIVSRDTQALQEREITRAAVETNLENGHDAVIASLFWFVIGGAPMVIIHRLANTLDAMWGYRNERFKQFGWFAARADDLLGLPSALVSGAAYLIADPESRGSWLNLAKKSFAQSLKYKSLNGGWTIGTGAHALKIKLGGASEYSGKVYQSSLGDGAEVDYKDIKRSTQLVERAVFVFILAIIFLELAWKIL